MESDALGSFRKSSASYARLSVSALMQVAALTIIIIRCLDLSMIFNTPGFYGTSEFTHHNVQIWNLMLVFLGSLVLLFIEIYCIFSLVKGWSWARWVYLLIQVITSVYLRAISLGCGYPELFSIAGGSRREILHTLVMQKLPDMLALLLPFIPTSGKWFSRL